jgi:hypothetical protein
MRQALGIAVLGGMLGVTVFGVFLTPVFFALVDRLTGLVGAARGQSRWLRVTLVVLDVAAMAALVLAIEFGTEALLYELVIGFALVLLAALLGMGVIATADTAETVAGAARRVGSPVRRFRSAVRQLRDAVRRLRPPRQQGERGS